MDSHLELRVWLSSHWLLVQFSHLLLRCPGISIFIGFNRKTPNEISAQNIVVFLLLTLEGLFTSLLFFGKHGQRERIYTG